MKKKYNIIFASHPDYSGSTKALYEYMKKHSKNMSLTWVIYDSTNSDLLKNNNIDHVLYGSNEFNEVFDKTDIVFFDHDELITNKKENQIYIYLGHGFSCKKFGYFLDGKNLAEGDKKYLELMKGNTDYMICASELWKMIYKIAFDFDYDRILPLGFPRTDYIYSKKSREKLELILNMNTKEFSKIIMYLPTFRSGLGRSNDGNYTENIFNIEKYDESSLDKYLKKNNYLLLIKYHPYEQNKTKKFESENIMYLEDEVMTKNLVTLAEIIPVVDLMVADYSSAHSEHLILDKPVCFLQNDIETYKKNRGINMDDTNFWFPGPYIKNLSDLKREIKKLFKDKNYYSKERKYYVELTFGKNTKNSAKKIYEYLFNSDFDFYGKAKKKANNELLDLYDSNIKLKKNINNLENTNKELQKEIKNIKNENEELNKRLVEALDKLDLILHSKGWKILEKARKVKNGFKRN